MRVEFVDTPWDSIFAALEAGLCPLRYARNLHAFSLAEQARLLASKAALVGMARSLTREIGSRGVTANVVAPGFIETDMTAVLPEDTIKGYLARIPAGRLGSVEDISAAVSYLASDAAGYVSGAIIPVDGGLGMGH